MNEKLNLPNQVLSYIRDPAVAVWRKASGLLAVIYVVSPIDFIPDLIPIVGWLDDLGIAGAVAWFIIRDIRKHTRQLKQGTPVPDSPDSPGGPDRPGR